MKIFNMTGKPEHLCSDVRVYIVMILDTLSATWQIYSIHQTLEGARQAIIKFQIRDEEDGENFEYCIEFHEVND